MTNYLNVELFEKEIVMRASGNQRKINYECPKQDILN